MKSFTVTDNKYWIEAPLIKDILRFGIKQKAHVRGFVGYGFLRLSFCLISLLTLTNTGNSQTYNGYTLYFPQGGTKAYLTDMAGSTYHTWMFSSNASTTYAAYLLSGGTLLRTVNHQGNFFNGGPISGEVQKVDWNGNILWDFVYSTQNYCSHHDIHAMPNGNVLLIAYERKTPAEVAQAGCSQSIEMWPDKIVEIQPSGTNSGTVVWEWHAWDHLVQHHDPTKSNYGIIADHPELLNINYQTSKDWMHMNGIDYNEVLDQIVFSSHSLDEIYVIDHSTTTAQAATHTGGNSGKGGDIIYRWGNPAAYETAGTSIFNVVHDAHWVPSDNPFFPNALCGYNNKGGTGGKTCVDILIPPYEGYNYSLTQGAAYAPTSYAWRHTYSGGIQQDNGSSQQLPNGNTLVCIGMVGLIYELNPSQAQVWSKSVGVTLAQAFRYPPCFVNGNYSANATAASASICSGTDVLLNVSATGDSAYSYKWVSDPPGFSSNLKNPIVSPVVTTIYTATITNGPCSASDSVTVIVIPLPETPLVTLHGDSLLSNSTLYNQWYLNGSVIQGANQQYYIPAEAGSYQVGVTDDNGCGSDLSQPYIFTSINDFQSESAIRIFPLPINGILNIKGFEGLSGIISFSVYSPAGQEVFSSYANSKIDISRLKPGFYIFELKQNENMIFSQKLILQN